jgi:signal transduction histidine kinase
VVLVSDDAASQALADAGGASDDFFVPDRDGKGICIGFGFCKRAAEEIGGRFNVESGGRGTTIRLEIPAGSVT